MRAGAATSPVRLAVYGEVGQLQTQLRLTGDVAAPARIGYPAVDLRAAGRHEHAIDIQISLKSCGEHVAGLVALRVYRFTGTDD